MRNRHRRRAQRLIGEAAASNAEEIRQCCQRPKKCGATALTKMTRLIVILRDMVKRIHAHFTQSLDHTVATKVR